MAHVRRVQLSCLLAGVFLSGVVAPPSAYAGQVGCKVKALPKRVARASWYGTSFQGKETAGGSIFNPQHLTAAHRTIDFGSKVRVTELRSGRSVVVEITDRGPYFPGRDIDLSYAAARQLGIVRRGVAQVSVEVLHHRKEASNAPIVTAFSWPATPWLPQAVVE